MDLFLEKDYIKSILVLATTYPHWKNGSEPLFVHHLCEQLTSEYRVIALVPLYPGASRKENMEGVLVHRFCYFLPAGELLAYYGGITQNLKKNLPKQLLVPFFPISQYLHITVREGFGLAAAESMAYGLPAVATIT